jgi:hypothetical protein
VHRDREEGALQGTDGASVSEGISSRGRWGTPVCGGQGRRVACCRSISSFAEQHSRESRPGRGPSAGRSRARDGGCLGVGGRGWNLLQVQGGSATPVFGGQGRWGACRSRPRAECRRATRQLWCGLCIAGPCEVSRNRELLVDDAALPLVDHAAVLLQPGRAFCARSHTGRSVPAPDRSRLLSPIRLDVLTRQDVDKTLIHLMGGSGLDGWVDWGDEGAEQEPPCCCSDPRQH